MSLICKNNIELWLPIKNYLNNVLFYKYLTNHTFHELYTNVYQLALKGEKDFLYNQVKSTLINYLTNI